MQMLEKESLELSVIMPCRNEKSTVGVCVDEAFSFMQSHNISGEVLVVDNASKDDSASLAAAHGARVIAEKEVGYGKAIRTGIANSRGRILIIGDCDTTYDMFHLEQIYEVLADGGCDMVIGNRYAGGMEQGSMPWLHRWGVRFLSCMGRLRFHTDVYDFHCGLRGIRREAVKILSFHTKGMEFATEMIAEAAVNKLCIMQIPVTLRKCKYHRKSKLRTIRDGLRHLAYIWSHPGKSENYEERN